MVTRAARPVCAALVEALRRHGVPEQILTDNGKVFTARFGLGPGPVTGCATTTGFGICSRRRMRRPRPARLSGCIRRSGPSSSPATTAATVEEVQALDAWVVEYNTLRPHQSCGGRPPTERFALADRSVIAASDSVAVVPTPRPAAVRRPPGVSRWVNGNGRISLAGFDYVVGATFAGEPVEVVVVDRLVEIWHAGVLVASHAQRLRADQADRVARVPAQRRARDATTGVTVVRLADNNGAVCFAGTLYRAGRAWRGRSIEVAIVAGSVQLACDGR